MKKIILLTAVIVTTTFAAKAQVAAGNLFIGGGIGFDSDKQENSGGGTTTTDPKSFGGYFQPQAGYFIADRFAVGVFLNVSGEKTEYLVLTSPPGTFQTATQTRSTFGAGLFGRYYSPINEQFYFWGQADLGFSSGKQETEFAGVTTRNWDQSTIEFAIRPGFSFFPSTRYSFDFTVGRIGFDSTTRTNSPGTTSENEVKNSNVGARFDLRTASVGINVFFGGGE